GAVLSDEAVTVSDWLSPPPALMPARFTVCSPASSGIAGGFGIGFSVGGSLTAFTVSVNDVNEVCSTPPTVFFTVIVIVATPDALASGVSVSVRAEPLPVRQMLAAGQTPPAGNRPGLSLVAVIESNAVVASPTLTVSDSGGSSLIVWFAGTWTIGSASTAPRSTVCVAAASAAPRVRANPAPRRLGRRPAPPART